MTAPEFETFRPPADTLWLTPDHTGVRFFLTPPDANGNELVGVQFTDAHAGAFALALHPASINTFIDGLQNVVDNIDALRAMNPHNPKGPSHE
jgi:hypothetical protein